MLDQPNLLIKVYDKRIQLLIQSVSQEDLSFLNECQFFQIAQINMNLILKCSGQIFQFYFDLFMTISRSWESYCKRNDGLRRFRDQKYSRKLKFEIKTSILEMNKLLKCDFTLKQYENEANLQKAKKNLKCKLKLLHLLLFAELTLQDIDDCFNSIQFISYQFKTNYCSIQSFTDFRGSIVYINAHHDKPDTLEWCMIEALYLWKINNQNPFLIPVEQSNYSRIIAGQPSFELGDLYFCQITKICPYEPSPFKMNRERMKFL